ncbi:MAG: excinuclease ABC subunit UvrC, partial [Actinomycetota bacterium]
MVRRPEPGTITESPGSYLFKDAHGRVIYVGKAANLRQRLSNYFQAPEQLHPRTAQMVATAETVEWLTVRNEVEALILEYNLIKEHRPRFNVRLRDDKSYPLLAVTTDEEWPRAVVMRGQKRKGTRYFGPYPHAHAIRETLDLLLRTFPIRTCSQGKFNQHARLGRPCLLFHIEQCSGPCVGEVSAEDYSTLVREFCRFLDGDTEEILDRLKHEMVAASESMEYERAARIRDRLQSVAQAMEKQQIVGERDEDIDVIGVSDDELEAAVQVFFVRKGRIVGRKGFVYDKMEELSDESFVDRIIELLYSDEPVQGIPRLVLVPTLPGNLGIYEEWLGFLAGKKVEVR